MRARRAVKIALLLILVAGVVALYFSPLRQQFSRDKIGAWVETVRHLRYGPVVLIVSYAIGCIFAIPASIFILAAGVIWGWKLGVTYAMCGAMLGATAAYFAGRFLGEGLLERFGKAGQVVSKQVKNSGFISMLIARLIPGPPFAVWNYAAGIARMDFLDYFFATLLGTLPAHIIFAYCADALFNGTMTQGEAVKRLTIVAVLLISMIVLTTILKRKFARPTPPEDSGLV